MPLYFILRPECPRRLPFQNPAAAISGIPDQAAAEYLDLESIKNRQISRVCPQTAPISGDPLPA